MATFGTDVANDILDLYFNTGTGYVSLHTDDPGASGANEVTGGTYARQVFSVGAAASKAVENDALIEFEGMPDCEVTHVGFWTDDTAGDFIVGGAVVTPKEFEAGDVGQYAIGDLIAALL